VAANVKYVLENDQVVLVKQLVSWAVATMGGEAGGGCVGRVRRWVRQASTCTD
jgi:hypothetical protein